MIKKLWILFEVILLCLVFCLMAVKPSHSAIEHFVDTYTETDPNGKLSQTATRVTWTALPLDTAGVGVIRDVTFSFANLSMDFEIFINSSSGADFVPAAFNMSNATDYVYLDYGESGSGKIYAGFGYGVNLEIESGYTTNSNTLLLDTLYYVRVKDTGTSLSIVFYGSAANRTAETSAVLTITHTHTIAFKLSEWNITIAGTYNAPSSVAHTGYLENLDIRRRRIL